MKKARKVLGVSILSIALMASPSIFSLAGELPIGVSGGWSESTGYFTVNKSPVNKGRKSDEPKEHKGKRLSKIVDSSGTIACAAYGETTWKNVKHYTTARMKLSDGTVKTTSGRQWGTGYTDATSPYYVEDIFENTEARTYYGR